MNGSCIRILSTLAGPLCFSSAMMGLEAQAENGGSPADPSSEAGKMRPNILFIAVDDLRPAIGAMGDPLAITPNLDRLARSGTTFERAYCQQAVCSPSRISLLTGLRPDTTGIYDLKTHHRDRVPGLPVLPEWFRTHGYQTIGRGKIFHGHLDDPKAWDSAPQQGSSLKGTMYALPENREKATVLEEGRPSVRKPPYERADVPDEAYTDGILAEQTVAELKALKSSDKPFFYAVGFIKPHLPFCAPEKYWALHDREKLWPPPSRQLPEGLPAWVSQPAWELRNAYDVPADYGTPLGEDLEKTLRHGYYAATSYVDAQIGKVLDALKASGLDKNTIVILWGDHGYHVGDHGTWCKHTNFEEAVHAPLLLRVPGRGEGARIPATVEFLDIYPTLVELAGLPMPEHLEGRSLAPFLDSPQRPADKPAFSQYPRGGPTNPMMGYSVTTGRWRYTEWIRTDTGAVALSELYDLEKDRAVTRNLSSDPAHADKAAELSTLLVQAGKNVEIFRNKAKKE